jgi:polyphenol oxidase
MQLPEGWIKPDWPAHPRVRSIITARAGGASQDPYASFNLGELTADDPQAVSENKHRLAQWLPAAPRWLRQVHGTKVVRADALHNLTEADASFTGSVSVVCAVKIADCMPVLLSDEDGTRVGIAHAGWRGLAGGVLERTVEAMGVPPAQLLAYLGPAIGPQAFEVGAEVRAAFRATDAQAGSAFQPLREGKWLADLFLLGRRSLARCGVERVYGGGLCTYSDPARFYSHRRNPITGRMAAFIWLDNEAAVQDSV